MHTESICMPQLGKLCSKERKPSDACHQSYLSVMQRPLEPTLWRFAGKFKESFTQFNKSTYTDRAVECTRYLRITCQVPFTFHQYPATWANYPIAAFLVYSPEKRECKNWNNFFFVLQGHCKK